MSENSIYFLTKPDKWPEPPEVYSYSSIKNIESCLLKWQLENATYGSYEKFPQRPNPKTIEGNIIHQCLEKLFKQLAFIGSPPIGSNEFKSVLNELNLQKIITNKIEKHNNLVEEHPRGSGFIIKTSPQILLNKVIRLFRTEYIPTSIRPSNNNSPVNNYSNSGQLSEKNVSHPDIPFKGIIDLVKFTNEGTILVDFKTGREIEEHLEQLTYYALLWWRETGKLPLRVEVRYLNSMKSLEIFESNLQSFENKLKENIIFLNSKLKTKPAMESLGEQCKYCQVKQFCNSYWNKIPILDISQENANKTFEGEIIISGKPTKYGFEAITIKNQIIPVVYNSDTEKIHGPFKEGEKLRIINGRFSNNGDSIEFKEWTEVFHL